MGGTPNLLESNVRNSKGFLLGEPIGTILWLLGFGLAEVIIAKQNWNSECDQPLHLWLMVVGVVSLVNIIFPLIRLIIAIYRIQNNVTLEDSPLMRCVATIFTLHSCSLVFFGITWYIIGSVWLWGSPNNQDTCPHHLKVMVGVILIIFYVLTAISLFVIISGTVLAIYISRYEGKVVRPIN